MITADEAARRLLEQRQRVLYGVRRVVPDAGAAAAAPAGGAPADEAAFVSSQRAQGMGADEEE
jgi:hypothetical protein